MMVLLLADGGGASMQQVVMILVIIVIAVATPFLVRLARRRRPADTTMTEIHEGARVREAADKALVELLETGREISAQIDNKIRVLNKLVKDADAEATRLESLMGRSQPAPKSVLPGSLKRSPEAPGAAGEVAQSGQRKRTSSGRGTSDLNRKILSLHREGASAGAIARKVRLSLQEVNLVLHINRDETGE